MTVIEVFTEETCVSCQGVISLVERVAHNRNVMVRVYDRANDVAMFYERGVVICPATCIDGRLAFYGEVDEQQLVAMITPASPPPSEAQGETHTHPKPFWARLLRTILGGTRLPVLLVLCQMNCAQQQSSEMVRIPGGTFTMGSGGGRYTDESPPHRVHVSPFLLDRYLVTNAQFAEFVGATHYVTEAERNGYGWVFRHGARDWEKIAGADWRHPEGPGSDIAERMHHPVVQVTWNDAQAFATWTGKRLPTEAEWEFAARGSKERQTFPWGDELMPDGKPRANFWQGIWPDTNYLDDGYYYTSPVGRFPPNSFGLYDIVGNVWEWCADWYDENYYTYSPAADPAGPPVGTYKVARGGSWFCSESYCGGYRNAFRGRSPRSSSFNNVGFRCAKSISFTNP